MFTHYVWPAVTISGTQAAERFNPGRSVSREGLLAERAGWLLCTTPASIINSILMLRWLATLDMPSANRLLRQCIRKAKTAGSDTWSWVTDSKYCGSIVFE